MNCFAHGCKRRVTHITVFYADWSARHLFLYCKLHAPKDGQELPYAACRSHRINTNKGKELLAELVATRIKT